MKAFFGIMLIAILLVQCSSNPGSRSGKNGTVTINQRKVYFEEYGQGPPLLMLSGGGLQRSTRDFEKCIPFLSAHFRIILADTPGQGKSEQTDSLTYAFIADVMSQLIDSLQLDSTYVMGFSDGGIVSILLAERRPDKVRKAIAVGANDGIAGFVLPDGLSIDSVKVPSVEEWAHHHEKDIEYYNALVPKRDWRKMATNLNRMWYEKQYFPKTVYGHIKIPFMIVVGDRDAISIDHAQEMYKSIKGSQLCILPNTSHEVFSEQPEIISRIATRFFVKSDGIAEP
jgi:pimeloyl-ACP methyl ester carboxylesterase